MTEELDGRLTRKGELARQRILESALRLFGDRGYEETTMREIAAEAGYSPGLTYRYFASKEELVLVLYQNLDEELDQYTRELPPTSLSERLHQTLSQQLTLLAPYRGVFSALFGTTLNPHSKVGVFGASAAEIRRRARKSYLRVIQGAKDAPREAQREDLATVLYGAHMALVLFWLIDQSKNAARTRLFLAFLCDVLKLMQPVLWLSPVRQSLARLATIIGPLLGDERYQDEDYQSNEVSL
ncbi:transcriptional regulator, TetR family [Ktedonobacter racemifer DSM 44963]|uniref:Transcriptional regulator, TetR family n=2 Tax=Ktedonobacter racemifer TaxID=363277 RepID=D6TXU8_KTERA|nr:transcriptional regulator, TetR family [Ktedonobacter racemifer DSM 44963]